MPFSLVEVSIDIYDNTAVGASMNGTYEVTNGKYRDEPPFLGSGGGKASVYVSN